MALDAAAPTVSEPPAPQALSSQMAQDAGGEPSRSYQNQPAVGLIRGVAHANPAAELSALKASVPTVPEAPVPTSAWRAYVADPKSDFVGDTVRGISEAITTTALNAPGATVSGIGKFVKGLGSAEQLASPITEAVGGAIESAGSAITPGDWGQPKTAIGRLPAAAGSAIGATFGLAGQGYKGVAELAGFPRVGAVLSNVVSAAPILAGGAEATGALKASSAPLLSRYKPPALPTGLQESAGSAPALSQQMAGGGAASANLNPYPQLTGQMYVRDGQFPVIKQSTIGQDVSPAEQAVRAGIANDLGVLPRPGVVNGNPATLAAETILKKDGTSAQGQVIAQQIATEQAAMHDLADNIVQSTGKNTRLGDAGSAGIVQDAIGREGLEGYYRAGIKQLYSAADKRAAGTPVQTPTVDAIMADPATESLMRVAGVQSLHSGLQGLIDSFKRSGFADESGAAAPNTAFAAEKMRQYLNQAWTPENSFWVGKIQDALDKDVLGSAGDDIYSASRDLNSQYKSLYESRLMQSITGGKRGTAGMTPSADLMDKIVGAPMEQFAPFYDALNKVKSMPGVDADLVSRADAALSEIRGALATKIYRAGASRIGAWDAAGVNKALNSIDDKLSYTMTPEQMADLHTLNTAGQIMPAETAYPGAALQTKKAGELGIVGKNLPAAGAAVGEFIAPGGAGAWTGAKLGTLLQPKLSAAKDLAAARALHEKMLTNAAMAQKSRANVVEIRGATPPGTGGQ